MIQLNKKLNDSSAQLNGSDAPLQNMGGMYTSLITEVSSVMSVLKLMTLSTHVTTDKKTTNIVRISNSMGHPKALNEAE